MSVIAQRVRQAQATRFGKEFIGSDIEGVENVGPDLALTTPQEKRLRGLVRSPVHPHALEGEPVKQDDGSIRVPVFTTKHGKHTVAIGPDGSLSRHGLDTPSED
jgi:hypothetical protein